MTEAKKLLAIIELGGYPNFTPIYQELGYQVTVASQMRKAVKDVKKNPPQVIVAEFNFQPDFRERVSNLESLFATLQSLSKLPHILVFYEKPHQVQLDKLQQRYPFFQALAFPIDVEQLKTCLEKLN